MVKFICTKYEVLNINHISEFSTSLEYYETFKIMRIGARCDQKDRFLLSLKFRNESDLDKETLLKDFCSVLFSLDSKVVHTEDILNEIIAIHEGELE